MGGPLVRISLEHGMSRPNVDATEGRKHNSATVLYIEYYSPKYSRDVRINWDEQINVEQDKVLKRDQGASNAGCKESVKETVYKTSLYRQLRLPANVNQIGIRERFLSMLAQDLTCQLQAI
jgi:hypothetical protein